MLGFGPFELLRASRKLHRDGQPLALRSSTFDILLALLERPGEVVPKRVLCKRAWPGREVDENNLQVEISALRKLIGAGAIVTASGRGYQFAWAVARLDVAEATLIGREQDLAVLRSLLAPGELVSVVGEGGVGKTRLVQALVHGDPSVSLARLDEAAGEGAVLRAIGSALELAAASRRELFDALKAGTTLLLLDTCDNALQLLAELAGALMAECPGVSLLATSREPLRVPGERLYRLAPLAAADALEWFRKCLHVARPGPLDTTERAAARALCEALGDNPLELELAAQYATGHGIAAARRQLEERLDWPNRRSDAAARQHSLRASLDWSCRALSANDRQVLAAVSTLAQPFQLDTLQSLPLENSLGRWDRLDALGRLVDKSLLSVERADAAVYRMSATTQLYARNLVA
jgi:predicted ATPase/DNA-binding winged helix-turn-helix (wHTH) protein